MKIYRFRVNRKQDSLFVKVLIGVGILQVILLLLLAGVMVTRSIIPTEVGFEAPPAIDKIEPQQKEMQVQMEKRQKVSNQLTKRITAVKIHDMQTPDVSIDLPSSQAGNISGSVDISNVKMEKLTLGVTPVSLFGLKAKAEKILIVFDTGGGTMTDAMGGLTAYNVVKGEIKRLVNGLPSTALFNVIAFDADFGTQAKFKIFGKGLMSATNKAKADFDKWMSTINNTVATVGLRENEYELKNPQPPKLQKNAPIRGGMGGRVAAMRWTIYQAAIEQGAEAIYLLTTHWTPPEYYIKDMKESDIARYKKDWEDAQKKSKDKIVSDEEFKSKMGAELAKAKKWLDSENARRRKKGVPEKVARNTRALAHELGYLPLKGVKDKNSLRPDNGRYGVKYYTRQSLFTEYEKILNKVYGKSRVKRPIFNIILMLPKNGDMEASKKSSMRSWATLHKGGIIILRGAKSIKEYETKDNDDMSAIDKNVAEGKVDESKVNAPKMEDTEDGPDGGSE